MFIEDENYHIFYGPSLGQTTLQSVGSRALFYRISIMLQISIEDSGIL